VKPEDRDLETARTNITSMTQYCAMAKKHWRNSYWSQHWSCL